MEKVKRVHTDGLGAVKDKSFDCQLEFFQAIVCVLCALSILSGN
jgi:hypothetical protein